MITRIDTEKREYDYLSKYACKSAESLGRESKEEKCSIRTDFQRDRDRIVHSKAFRRLMHKTQVFLAPEGDHFRTRLTHTIEVSQIARTIARALALNEDLTEAIALGHDLGHTPFGHNGEVILSNLFHGGFNHNEQSLRVCEILEDSHGKGKRGMNLTKEVKDGILNHSGPNIPFTLEGQVVRISDRIAYINHDIDDAIRSRVIKSGDLPTECIKLLGDDHRTRINTLVIDLVKNSEGKDVIQMSEEIADAMSKLRTFMFKSVYHNNVVKKASDLDKVENIITSLYEYYLNYPEKLPMELNKLIPEFDKEEIVKDFIAGMTDRYAINLYDELFIPKGWK